VDLISYFECGTNKNNTGGV